MRTSHKYFPFPPPVVNSGGQREIVVVGGTDNAETRLSSVEIFNVDTGVWREGEEALKHATLFGSLEKIYRWETVQPILQLCNLGRDFPLHIEWHAQVRFEETFLITGGWGGVHPSSTRELNTIYRLVHPHPVWVTSWEDFKISGKKMR